MSKKDTGSDIGMSRREFIGKSAVLTAGYTIVKPGVIKGDEANRRIKVGVIGLGQRGSWIGGLFDKHSGFEVCAVCDYFEEIANEVGDKLKVAKDRRYWGLMGYKRLLASGVDAVALETPPYCFAEHASAAVDAGCHVFMAKPVATDVPGCRRIKQAGEKAGGNKQVFMVDFQMRVDPYLVECVERVRKGGVKDMFLIEACYHGEGFKDPEHSETLESRMRNLIWVSDIELGGGYLVNAGIHAVDAALWICDKLPVSCMGRASIARKNAHGNARDCYSMTYRFEDERFLMNYSAEHRKNLSVYKCGCDVYGLGSLLEGRYGGKNWIHGGEHQYKGGSKGDLYTWAPEQNIKTFHDDIVEGRFANRTLEPSVNSTLASILGREASVRGIELRWDEMMKENKKYEVDLSGMKM